MLSNADLVAFVPTRDPARARPFYRDVLGLQFISEDGFATVFRAHGVTVRIANVAGVPDFVPAPFTILGWNVPDVATTVRDLAAAGVVFERYPGMSQDALGIWDAPSGARVAWFKDPDGNILSVSEI